MIIMVIIGWNPREDDGYLVCVGPKEKKVERNRGNKVNYKPTPEQQNYCEKLLWKIIVNKYCENRFLLPHLQNKRNLPPLVGKNKLTELIRRIAFV